jgi:fluoride ion exporter CrcB/FEX
VELLEMLDAGRLGLAVLYIAASVTAGLLAAQAATTAARRASAS